MDTARSIISTSLQWIKAYSPSETVIDSDAELCLDQLNAMLDSWSNESLSCFAIAENSIALTVGQSSYTIGFSGILSATYTSGINCTGTAGQMINLAFTGGGGAGATGTVALTGTNTIASGTLITITAAGTRYTSAPTTATASTGTATYTSGTPVLTSVVNNVPINTNANINSQRPIRLMEGPGAAYLQDTNGNNYFVNVVTRDKWNQIGLRTVTSDVPDTIFYDPTSPLGTIHVFPVPSQAYTLYFDSFQQLNTFATLSSAFSFPPGYKAAITSNFAVWVKPFFKSAVIDPDLKSTARQTKMNIKRSNRRTAIAVFDSALISRAQATYNVYTDDRGV